MEQNKPGFSSEKYADNDNRKSQRATTTTAPVTPKPATAGQRWNAVQLSKTAIVWTCLAVVAATMLVGFTWGGWVTGGTAQKAATTLANDAVVQRLTAICVAQFQQDSAKETKLVELKAITSYRQSEYVKEQGWASMPGDEQSDTKVAAACAKLLVQLN